MAEIQGSIVRYHTFNVADAISVQKLDKLFKKKLAEEQLSTGLVPYQMPSYLKYKQPPKGLKLQTFQLEVNGQKVKVEESASIYDFGVISVTYRIPFDCSLREARLLMAALDSEKRLQEQARKTTDRILREISEAMDRPLPNESQLSHEYVIMCVNNPPKGMTAKTFVKKNATEFVHALRMEKNDNLSDSEIDQLLKDGITYYKNDFVIVTMDSALVVDEANYENTLEVLEFANIQALELMEYDKILDLKLGSFYKRLSRTPPLWELNAFADVAKELRELRLEIQEFMERLDNALKLIGDNYLARIYHAYVTRAHTYEWEEDVTRKLELLEQLYETTNSRVQENRMYVMELLVVVLILAEVILFFK